MILTWVRAECAGDRQRERVKLVPHTQNLWADISPGLINFVRKDGYQSKHLCVRNESYQQVLCAMTDSVCWTR